MRATPHIGMDRALHRECVNTYVNIHMGLAPYIMCIDLHMGLHFMDCASQLWVHTHGVISLPIYIYIYMPPHIYIHIYIYICIYIYI